MKKLITIFIICCLTLALVFSMASCGDNKDNKETQATQDTQSTDNIENTESEQNKETTCSHTWVDADCDTPKTCSICGATEGEALGHTAEADDGNCTTEVKCTVCGDVTTPAGQHTPNADDGDCTTPIVCSVCETITTPAKESHTGGTATCTEKAVCTVCSTAYGTVDANNHIDENTDHICDRECGKTDIGTHADSAEDNDHVCDYGCGVILEDHKGGDGTATCEHGKVCSVCGEYYGDTLEHNYTYTANDDTNTITAACVNSCGHSQTIELNAPENAIYNGNKIEATVTGADGITYSLTYNADPVGSGTYTATLTVGDKSVSIDFTIAKATPTYEVPTGLTATYGDTIANVEGLPTGWTWKDAESTSVGNAGTRTFKALYNPDSNNYNTVEADITVEVAKALIDIYTDNLINPEFAEGLIYNDTAQALVTNSGSIDGGYIVFSLNPDGEYTTEIPVATEAGEYVVYYRIEGDENHYWEGSSAFEAVTIAKANPEYTISTGLTATYGDTLANVELPTGWAWKDAETTSVGNAGTRTFKALYNPDSNNYNTVEADVTVEVAKANPEYTVPTGLTATYGDTLAKVELPTGWAWNDAESTSVGNAGTRPFKALYNPDSNNYNTAEADVTIEVAKAEIDGSTLINPEFEEGLIYNGTAQALVTKTGSVDGGYIVYSLSIDGEYTTTIPVATEAGTYRVYWTIECDENHYVDGTPGSSRVTIAAKDASNATVMLDDTSVQFDGTAKTPGVTSVVVDGKTLNAETDYEVSYRDNTYVGTATVTITFKGNYTGTATATFEIIQDPNTDEFDGEWVIF